MPMMGVRIMCMGVQKRRMGVPVSMWLARRIVWSMIVLMMLIVNMGVLMV